ncbi:MAG: dihydrolipoyl dehydrogenase [Nitrospirota bacterium]
MFLYDIVILGAGPGGYVAAIRAAQLGAKVCIIEKEHVGGTCLNWGCIPTKAMYRSATLFEQMRKAGTFGLSCKEPAAHLDRIVARNQQIVSDLRQGVERLFRRHKVNLIFGTGVVKEPGEVEIVNREGAKERVRGRQLIIATGSEPMALAILPWDHERVFNTRSILDLKRIPKSLFIIGGGVSGCEFALVFGALGSEIHMAKRSRDPIKGLDRDVTQELIRVFKKRRFRLHFGDPPVAAVQTAGGIEVALQSDAKVETEMVLVTVGRVPASAGLGFEEIGLHMEEGAIQVDEHCRTNVSGIYAIGDVTGRHLLAHYASHQGLVAVEQALGNRSAAVAEHAVPAAIFTSPEIATVGLTSQKCEQQGISYRQGIFPFRALGKAQAIGEIEGFVKVIAERESDRIIGMHIIGPDASTLLAECTLAVNRRVTLAEFAGTIHAHPTLAEALWEAVEDARGRSIHKLDLGL